MIIGELIKQEVERQGLRAEEFAKMIPCGVKNVYKIYKRSNIETTLLALISKVLNHNFFIDIVQHPELSGVDDPEATKEVYNNIAIQQFMDCIPRVMQSLGMVGHIAFDETYDTKGLAVVPDFLMLPYGITFTVGKTLKDRLLEQMRENNAKPEEYKAINNYFRIQTITNGEISMDLWNNQVNGSQSIDICLDYKEEAEWDKYIRVALDAIYTYYLPKNIDFPRPIPIKK